MQSSTAQSDCSESDSKYVFTAPREEVHADTRSRHRLQPLTAAFSSAFAVQASRIAHITSGRAASEPLAMQPPVQPQACQAQQPPDLVLMDRSSSEQGDLHEAAFLGHDSLASTSSPSSHGLPVRPTTASPGSRERTSSAEPDKTRKLSQNREAARKSRERRKQQTQAMKDELTKLRAQLVLERREKAAVVEMHMAARSTAPMAPYQVPFAVPCSNPYQEAGPSTAWAADALGPSSIGLLPSAPVDLPSQADQHLQAIKQWHEEHAHKAAALCLVNHEGTPHPVLQEHVNDVHRHLLLLFQMKADAVRPCVAPYSLQLKINDCLQLQGPAALAILSLQHLPECQRRFAPLGVISCSDVCAGAQAKLAPGLQPHHHLFLDLTKVASLQASLARQEQGLRECLSGIASEVTQHVATFQTSSAGGGEFMHTKFQLMAEVFQMADRLWEDFLQRAEQCLALPQFAVVLSGLAETAAGLAELWHSHQPVMQHQTGVWPVLLAAGLDATAASTRTMSLP